MLVLTTFDLDEVVYDALRAGASGFLLKDAPEERLTTAIRGGGRRWVTVRPERDPALIEEFARRPELPANRPVSR